MNIYECAVLLINKTVCFTIWHLSNGFSIFIVIVASLYDTVDDIVIVAVCDDVHDIVAVEAEMSLIAAVRMTAPHYHTDKKTVRGGRRRHLHDKALRLARGRGRFLPCSLQHWHRTNVSKTHRNLCTVLDVCLRTPTYQLCTSAIYSRSRTITLNKYHHGS